MARIDGIKDFAGQWDRYLKERVTPGSTHCNYRYLETNLPLSDDLSIERAEAVLLHKRFGSIRDDVLGYGRWALDWSDKCAPQPTVRLSPDLFAHVADACEAP